MFFGDLSLHRPYFNRDQGVDLGFRKIYTIPARRGEASAFFAVALHKDVKGLDEEAAASGGRALFGNDDGEGSS